ncbi:unnamed protein product, partial [Adineta steineri]
TRSDFSGGFRLTFYEYYAGDKTAGGGGAAHYCPGGRPVKLSNKTLERIVKSVNNQCGISQRKIGRRFNVHQSTNSRNLRKRTSIVIRKRRTASKMDSEDEERRSKTKLQKIVPQIVKRL